MPQLYCSASDLYHWYIHLDGWGWVRFPARAQGWRDRRAVEDVLALKLREVPAWLAFGTGMLEACRTLGRAA